MRDSQSVRCRRYLIKYLSGTESFALTAGIARLGFVDLPRRDNVAAGSWTQENVSAVSCAGSGQCEAVGS